MFYSLAKMGAVTAVYSAVCLSVCLSMRHPLWVCVVDSQLMKFLQHCLDFGLTRNGSNPLTRNEETLAQVCVGVFWRLHGSWLNPVETFCLSVYLSLPISCAAVCIACMAACCIVVHLKTQV
jgi:hypothetical protein